MREDKTVLWAIVNITGLAITIAGMFGVVGLLDFEYSIYVFILGTVITLISMVFILRLARSIMDSSGGRDNTRSGDEGRQ